MGKQGSWGSPRSLPLSCPPHTSVIVRVSSPSLHFFRTRRLPGVVLSAPDSRLPWVALSPVFYRLGNREARKAQLGRSWNSPRWDSSLLVPKLPGLPGLAGL